MLSSKSLRTTCEISGDKLPENSSSSTSIIGSNNDLLIQILLYLPVKSLLKFKSVSKRWLSLISDPYFIHNHCLRNHHSSISGLFLQKTSNSINPEYEFIFLDGAGNIHGGIPFKSLNFVNDPAGIKIQQSCNGLLCCSSSFKSSSSNNNNINRSYYIYNPSTKHYTILPESQFRKNNLAISVRSISLAFDPLKSPYYEAICFCIDDQENYHIEIYSSKTASWRFSGDPFPVPNDDSFFKSGVFWNGSLHWISLNESSESISLSEYSLYYFDVGRELLKRMPVPLMPEYECETRKIAYFGECRGHLHLIEIYDSCNTHFDILEMEIGYTRWMVKYRVYIEGMDLSIPKMVHDDSDSEEEFSFFEYSVLLVEEEKEKKKEEKEEESTLVLHMPKRVISFDHKELICKKIQYLQQPSSLCVEGSLQFRWFDAYQYIESLACV
ncbi:F-box domain [Macleaya cordata]|uniref:F-box domain n=1 Tax=Macleaya cordata TaxID=56857 RepID=A0A200R978_MACCD|nr:F-box domain [Macleaya cordata]